MRPAKVRSARDSFCMKKLSQFLCLIGAAGGLWASNLLAAEPPNPDAEKFLVPYEQVLKALVDDNLEAAKGAAHTLPNGAGNDLENSKDLKAARAAFATISQTAEKMAAGVPGYHVFYCPMAKKDWVQQTTTVANPYEGKEMLTCGVEKK